MLFSMLREKRIDEEARTKPGSSMQKVWIEIFNPTESDKGKYTLEMFDGKETHKRFLDLSGKGECKCHFSLKVLDCEIVFSPDFYCDYFSNIQQLLMTLCWSTRG